MKQKPHRFSLRSNIPNIILASILAAACLSVSGCKNIRSKPVSTAEVDSVLYRTSQLLRPDTQGVSISGAPVLIHDTPYGDAVYFDGVDDAIFLDTNPLKGLSSFTVEVLIRPDAGGSQEPRFLHMGAVSKDRMMLELRLTDDGQFALDSFLRAGEAYLVLLDQALEHPVGEWTHLAVVVENGHVKNYVNGKFELEGDLVFHPMQTDGMSIGVRANRVHWFKGAIHSIRVTPRALSVASFTALPATN